MKGLDAKKSVKKKPAKTAKVCVRTGAPRCFCQGRNGAHQRIAGFNGNTRFGVSVGFCGVIFCVHLLPLARTGLEFHVYVA